MQTLFEQKKLKLLNELRTLALKHNRDYYVSLIPHVERATESESDIIDMYTEAIDQDRSRLTQSRDALMTVSKITSLF